MIRPDFKANRRKKEMSRREARHEELLYKFKPYLELCAIVLTVGTLMIIFKTALG